MFRTGTRRGSGAVNNSPNLPVIGKIYLQYSFSRRSRYGQHPLTLPSIYHRYALMIVSWQSTRGGNTTFLVPIRSHEEGITQLCAPAAIARLLDTRLKQYVLCCLEVMFILDGLVLTMRHRFLRPASAALDRLVR
jgi:hypothetical protein